MFRVFRSDWFEKKLSKLDPSEQQIVKDFEQELKQQPYSGRPLGYKFFREKKFDGKRALFLIYEDHHVVFMITIVDKKTQQEAIDMIVENLDIYRTQLEGVLKKL